MIKKFSKYIGVSFISFISASNWAMADNDNRESVTPSAVTTDTLDSINGTSIQNNLPGITPSIKETQQALQAQQIIQNTLNISVEELEKDPVLYTQVLNIALAAQDLKTVKRLLPAYRSLAKNDPLLIRFADAMVYRSDLNNKAAIQIYENILKEHPDYHPVRLNLAATLYSDKQYKAAKQQYLKLLTVEKLPKPVTNGVLKAINRINNTEKWQFDVSISYLQNDNIDNVPLEPIENALGFLSPEPKSVKGAQLVLGADKRYNLSGNLYSTLGMQGSFKVFDEKEYNDHTLTASTGIGYDDNNTDIALSPFFSRRVYDGEAFNKRIGTNLTANQWITPKLRLSANAQIARTKHNEQLEDEDSKSNGYLDNDSQFYGFNALYTLSAKQYVFGGVNYFNNDATNDAVKNKDRYSYDVWGLNVGWGKEWQNKIATRLTTSYSRKKYDMADVFRNQINKEPDPYTIRQDDTIGANLQVWKKDFSWNGLTPRLSFVYSKTDSNINYYDNRETKSIDMVVTKSF